MDALLARLQRAVAGHYTVPHELGRGMAVVFHGWQRRAAERIPTPALRA